MKALRQTLESKRGSALLPCLVLSVFAATLAASAFSVVLNQSEESGLYASQVRALYVAEAGVNRSVARLAKELEDGAAISTSLGSEANPMDLGGGRYWVEIDEPTPGTFSIRSHGRARQSRRSLECVINQTPPIFDFAIYAGNSGEDDSYTMTLRGQGGDRDEINGDIYSGGDIEVLQDATVNGNATAGGTITGTSGTSHKPVPPPDLSAIDYGSIADYDVAAEFDQHSTRRRRRVGIVRNYADELSSSNPSHIFRRNPSDRTTETSSTVKDDYFLEDPYAPNALYYTVSMTPGSGDEKIFYIDGNLWIHSNGMLSFKLKDGPGDPVKVTFAVRGNIYLADDFKYEDSDTDAVAFIALKDDAVADSGNIYFGDPAFGTFEEMSGFMYAEDTFHDNNFDPDGTQVFGTMSAGNKVSIDRTVGSNHSPLTVEFDDRLKTGAIDLPGIPGQTGQVELTLSSWTEISAH